MRRVALLIETSRTYGRDLLRGVKRYAQAHGPWSLFVEVRDLETRPPVWLRNWDGDGILNRSGSAAIATAVRRAGVPAVELRSTRRGSTFPFVGVDNTVVASMAAHHFLERGFRHYGVFALDTEPFLIERRQSFVDYLRARGHECSVLRQPGKSEKPEQWEAQQKRLMNWLSDLPRPTAIMACTDQLGCWLLDKCSRSSIRVPEGYRYRRGRERRNHHHDEHTAASYESPTSASTRSPPAPDSRRRSTCWKCSEKRLASRPATTAAVFLPASNNGNTSLP